MTPLAVQWLKLHASNAGGEGLIPGQGTKNPPADAGVIRDTGSIPGLAQYPGGG